MITSGHELLSEISLTHATTGTPQKSDAITEAVSGAGTSAAHWTVMSAGQPIEGGIVSLILIIWVHTEVLPQESLAVNTLEITTGQLPLGVSS